MKSETAVRIREYTAIVRYRDALRKEIRERIVSEGARSRCAFSGQGTCSGPDHSHPCLAALRSRYVGACRSAEKIQRGVSEPSPCSEDEDPDRPPRAAL